MFGLGLPEIIFVFLLAALILGPEHMPRVARTLGKWSAKARSAATTLGEAVTQDEEVRAAARDLSQLQTEIGQAKSAVLSLKGAFGEIAGAEANGAAGGDAKTESERTGASAGTETMHAERNGAETQQARPSPFFSRPLASIVARSDVQPSPGENSHSDARRSVALPPPQLLPESESRKVCRKIAALPPARAGEYGANARAAAVGAPDIGRALCRIRRLTPPQPLPEAESRKVFRKIAALPPTRAGEYGANARAAADSAPDIERALRRVALPAAKTVETRRDFSESDKT